MSWGQCVEQTGIPCIDMDLSRVDCGNDVGRSASISLSGADEAETPSVLLTSEFPRAVH